MSRAWWVVMWAAVSACPVRQAAIDERCTLNSDCEAPLVCAFQRCHLECNTDEDCPLDPNAGVHVSCVPSDRPNNVCLLKSEATCLYNTQCPAGLVCARDQRCRLACVGDVDCLEGQVCAQGGCALQEELVDGGLPVSADAGAAMGATCLHTSDCPEPFVCLAGQCVVECVTTRDCTAPATCLENACVAPSIEADPDAGYVFADGGRPTGWGDRCVLHSDCPSPLICLASMVCGYECLEARDCGAGGCCLGNECFHGASCTTQVDGGMQLDGGAGGTGTPCLNDLDCLDSDLCDGTELCVNRRCQEAPHRLCDDGNPCTTDLCTDGVCTYATAMDAGDFDHDGHYAMACGGGADDCDDADPTVWLNAPERCDYKDNNCNGTIDEGLWRERPGSFDVILPNFDYPSTGGAVAVLPIDGGFLLGVSSDGVRGTLDVVRTDPSLVAMTAPVAVLASTTQWTTNNGTGNLPYGKRLVRPQLTAGNGTLLASAFIGNAPGEFACTGPWVTTMGVTEVDLGTLAPTHRWQPPWERSGLNCLNAPDAPNIGPPVVANYLWSSAAGEWLINWAPIGNDSSAMQVAHADPDGGLYGQHQLLVSDPQNHSLVSKTQLVTFLAPSPMFEFDAGVVVAWGGTSNQPRLVLMDPSLSAPLSNVVWLQEGCVAYLGAKRGVDGQSVALLLSNVGGCVLPPHLEIREYLPDGTPLSTPLSSPAVIAGPSEPFGITTVNQGDVLPTHGGYAVLTTRWPNEAFTFLTNDGGQPVIEIGMSSTQRSQPILVPMSDTELGLVWTDGQLKRGVIECVE